MRVSLVLLALQEVDEVLETFSIIGVFSIVWIDENMIWDSSNYSGINMTMFGYENVWVPELILTNPSEKLDSFGKAWQLIRYASNGTAYWAPGNLMKATCSINVYYFPYDIQNCYIETFVWAYRSSEVELIAQKSTVDTTWMSEYGTWRIIETRVDITDVGRNSRARFVLLMERKPQYILMNIILPILFLNLLNVLVFVLPADSGERISFSITVLLAIAVFMTIVSDILPKTSEPLPLISYLLLTSLIITSVITLITVLNLRLFHNKNSTVPGWLTTAYGILQRPGCNCCRRTSKVTDDDPTKQTKIFSHSKSPSILPSNKRTMSLHKLHEKENIPIEHKNQDESGELVVTWQDISVMIDKITLTVSTLVIVLGFAVFLFVTKASTNNRP